MVDSNLVERRDKRKHAFVLQRSFLFYLPKKIALSLVAIGFAITIIADLSTPQEVWMGPIYLFLMAFTAWAISGMLAVLLGVISIGITWATSGMSFYPYGPELALSNIAIRFLCVLMIVGFMVIARRSSEREWKLARFDPLTGALNRQAFFEIFQSARHRNDWCVLAYADLDGLKRLNDERGHEAGDEGIKAFSENVRGSIRHGDVFARLGGDEFVVFLRVDSPESGFRLSERLHAKTNSAQAKLTNTLSCSWGVLLLPPGPPELDEQLKSADNLMYRAKRSKSGIVTDFFERNRM